ncbi:MAG: hypothetical protein JEY71_05445 [Sphaerochaeta sp.]|nr:hypothetical protein [Sphaerochaeta sp.]
MENNKEQNHEYEVEEELYEVVIAPIIIPFEEPGSIETILINAIRETGIEEQYITTQAKEYINTFVLKSGQFSRI